VLIEIVVKPITPPMWGFASNVCASIVMCAVATWCSGSYRRVGQSGQFNNLHDLDGLLVQSHDLLAPLVALLQGLVSCVFFFHGHVEAAVNAQATSQKTHQQAQRMVQSR